MIKFRDKFVEKNLNTYFTLNNFFAIPTELSRPHHVVTEEGHYYSKLEYQNVLSELFTLKYDTWALSASTPSW
jgi:hypothetical protein